MNTVSCFSRNWIFHGRRYGRECVAWRWVFYFVIPRAVAQSSNLKLRLFCCHFLAEHGSIVLKAPGGRLSPRAAASAWLGATKT